MNPGMFVVGVAVCVGVVVLVLAMLWRIAQGADFGSTMATYAIGGILLLLVAVAVILLGG